ncbi:lisH domain-containing protein C1711.05-like [Telopea speciosissima]|uniref:lisH domain-containing protein C1711.05-like n=1 Tax=Telopea speciosissima TaxID=54955 RepID=UPI001CC5D3BB|nr:lisH domain-containing protein C1711.05-like [Telopea speciosissima]
MAAASSPECIRGQTPVPEKATTEGFEKPGQLSPKLVEESNEMEKTDVQQSSPDIFGDKKLSGNSEGQAGSSSDSGSDSNSGSDSGSQSRSVGKSSSPAGSGSESSSTDSESNGSSSSKEGMPSQPSAGRRRDALFSDTPHHLSPHRLNQDSHEDHAIQPGQRSLEISARGKAPDRTDRSNKYVENLGRGLKLSEKNSVVPDESNGSAFRSMHAHEKGSMPREKHDEDSCAYEKLMNKNVRKSVNGDRSSLLSNMQYRNHVEQVGKSKDAGHMLHPDMGPLPMHNNRSDEEKSPVVNGRGALLGRELSDLELGELREPMPGEETQVVKKQFERKTSFKLSKNKHKCFK